MPAGLLPDDKVTAIRDLQASGQKAIVAGDGINESCPALSYPAGHPSDRPPYRHHPRCAVSRLAAKGSVGFVAGS